MNRLPLGVDPGKAGDEMLALTMARQALRQAVLVALTEEGSGGFDRRFVAWKAVDDAAITLARVRRRYDRHVREVTRNPPPGAAIVVPGA